jgi:predicted metal-dependent hydrolase
VENLFPDWRTQRHWLRQHGASLKAELDRLIGDVAD